MESTLSYLCNDFLNSLFVTFHLNITSNLRQVYVFSIAFRDDFIKSTQQFK